MNGMRHGQGIYTSLGGVVEEGIFDYDAFKYAKTPSQDKQTISASSGSGFAGASELPDDALCRLAVTNLNSGQKSWRSSTSFHVVKAKKRGLSCGVLPPAISASKSQSQSESQTISVINQTQLAINLLNGYGVVVDKEKAFNLLLLSATKRDSRALLWLGRMYKEGDGVLKNYKKSYMWLSLAALNGPKNSKAYLAAIEDLLDTRSLIEAQDLSSQCVEKNYQDC
jgi:TPR repeat protein